jgi:hypothetical protein
MDIVSGGVESDPVVSVPAHERAQTVWRNYTGKSTPALLLDPD